MGVGVSGLVYMGGVLADIESVGWKCVRGDWWIRAGLSADGAPRLGTGSPGGPGWAVQAHPRLRQRQPGKGAHAEQTVEGNPAGSGQPGTAGSKGSCSARARHASTRLQAIALEAICKLVRMGKPLTVLPRKAAACGGPSGKIDDSNRGEKCRQGCSRGIHGDTTEAGQRRTGGQRGTGGQRALAPDQEGPGHLLQRQHGGVAHPVH